MGPSHVNALGLLSGLWYGWLRVFTRPINGPRSGSFGLLGSTKTQAHSLSPNIWVSMRENPIAHHLKKRPKHLRKTSNSHSPQHLEISHICQNIQHLVKTKANPREHKLLPAPCQDQGKPICIGCWK